jgi:hypothetical protein
MDRNIPYGSKVVFGDENPGLTHSPNSNRLLLSLSAITSQYFTPSRDPLRKDPRFQTLIDKYAANR